MDSDVEMIDEIPVPREPRAQKDKSHLPFVEKYRPEGLEEIISHKGIITTVQKFIDGKKLPHLLFHGPPGTGKTSCILAIARQMYPKGTHQNMILELNASDDRGIKVVRDQIKTFCSSMPMGCTGLKLVILDECDSMTSQAQFALRRIVEKYTRTTRFCFVCNYVSKMIPALQSRSTKFRFKPLDSDSIKTKLDEIAVKENLVLKGKAGAAIVDISKGDMRKVLNILESCAMNHKVIDESVIYEVTGRPSRDDMKEVMDALGLKEFSKAMDLFMQKKEEKFLALEDIIAEVHKLLMRLDMKDNMKMFLVKRMAEIEYRLAHGCSEKPQIASLVGAFIEVRSFTS